MAAIENDHTIEERRSKIVKNRTHRIAAIEKERRSKIIREFLIAICRPTGDKWQSKTFFMAFVIRFCRLLRVFSIAAYLVYSCSQFTVSVCCLFLAVPWVCVLHVIVSFPGRKHVPYGQKHNLQLNSLRVYHSIIFTFSKQALTIL